MGQATEVDVEINATKIAKWAGAITGTAAVAAVGWGIYNHFMPRAEAELKHGDLVAAQVDGDAKLAEYDEIGQLETQLSLTRLEIKQLNGTMERRPLTADETTQLDYLGEKLLLIEQRLDDLMAQFRAGDA